VDIPTIIVSVVSVIVAIASWATSASKSRVDNLCNIIDAQSARIGELEKDLTQAKFRITELEGENVRYVRLLRDNCIEIEEGFNAT